MATSASIDIKLSKPNGSMITPSELIRKLLEFGWTLNDNGKMSYLPVGDEGEYDWKEADICLSSIIEIIEKKEKLGETIGIVITWGDTGIGGSLLIWSSQEISLNLSINRKVFGDINSTKITDVNWYSTKLLPALYQNDILVETFTFQECI